jgi:hypothetical protein
MLFEGLGAVQSLGTAIVTSERRVVQRGHHSLGSVASDRNVDGVGGETAVAPAEERAEKRCEVLGVVQGIVLVTFPAASTIFTDPDRYDLSNTQSGYCSCRRSSLRSRPPWPGRLGRRFGRKLIYLGGFAAGLVAMGLLIVSQFVETNTAVAFPLLGVATGFLGSRVRPHRAGPEHAGRRLPPGRRRVVCPPAECAARPVSSGPGRAE